MIVQLVYSLFHCEKKYSRSSSRDSYSKIITWKTGAIAPPVTLSHFPVWRQPDHETAAFSPNGTSTCTQWCTRNESIKVPVAYLVAWFRWELLAPLPVLVVEIDDAVKQADRQPLIVGAEAHGRDFIYALATSHQRLKMRQLHVWCSWRPRGTPRTWNGRAQPPFHRSTVWTLFTFHSFEIP